MNTTQPKYPFPDGDVFVLGPEIIASTEEPERTTVISWRGASFAFSPEQS